MATDSFAGTGAEKVKREQEGTSQVFLPNERMQLTGPAESAI
jgi:hypothetical protein